MIVEVGRFMMKCEMVGGRGYVFVIKGFSGFGIKLGVVGLFVFLDFDFGLGFVMMIFLFLRDVVRILFVV